MFDWSDTVFRRRNVTRRRISNTVLQPRYWGREADSPEVCRLIWDSNILHYDVMTLHVINDWKNKWYRGETKWYLSWDSDILHYDVMTLHVINNLQQLVMRTNLFMERHRGQNSLVYNT
jgi:hypothetical protein